MGSIHKTDRKALKIPMSCSGRDVKDRYWRKRAVRNDRFARFTLAEAVTVFREVAIPPGHSQPPPSARNRSIWRSMRVVRAFERLAWASA